MKNIGKRIAQLTPQQRALLELKRKKLNEQKEREARIPRLEGEGPWPASTDQAAFWFFHQLNPGTTAYNMGMGHRLNGSVDETLLTRTFNEMCRRHAIFRTSFRTLNGKPYQYVEPNPHYGIPIIDLSDRDADEKERLLSQEVSRLVQTPFELSQGPLIHLTLIRLSDTESLLIAVIHHCVSDLWSYQLFVKEFFLLYRAFYSGLPSPLPALPIQFSDYAVWRNKWLEGEAYEKQREYWLNQLRGAPLVLELPTDKQRPAVQKFHGAQEYFIFPAALMERLQTISRQAKATNLMTMLAVTYVFLGRYAGVDDVLIGMAATNRELDELQNLIGYLLNLMVLRGDLSGDPSFLKLLERVRGTVLDGFANKEYPFRELVEALNPPRDLSRLPIYQVDFVYVGGDVTGQSDADHHVPEGMKPLPFAMEGYGVDRGSSAVDLEVAFTELPEGTLLCTIEYCTDLFEAATVKRMGGLLENLTRGLFTRPNAPISQAPWMDDASRRFVLGALNDRNSGYPRDTGLHALFKARAAAHPDAPAVVSDMGSLSYLELDLAANRIANRLLEQGLTPDAPVGLCLPQKPELIAAILGILKAGGAYVPLDPDYPQERLIFMLQDTGMSALVTETDMLDYLPAFEINFLNTILLDEEEAEGSDQDPGITADIDQLAYIIYTSGTTGQPKGVQVSHRNVIRLISDHDYAVLAPGDGVAQVSSTSFDAFTFEIWTALTQGGRLCLVDKQNYLSPERFAEEIIARQLHAMFITSALFSKFARVKPDMFHTMKHVLVGGDQVEAEAVRTVLASKPPQRLLNGYGPTESTTFAAWHHFQNIAEETHMLPIGGPIADSRLYLVDRLLNPVPVGVLGELLIGGDGLARGYLNRPELSAEKFIPDPFADNDHQGGRLYRTGDLGKRLPDGTIECHGRLDNQLKIRGFRIEPEEIENVLAAMPGVGQVLVLALKAGSTEVPTAKQLAAYLTHTGDAPTPAELRHFLKDKLPDYMVPASFTLLETFPLTPNGKIDRAALPKPDDSSNTTGTAPFVAPRNSSEETLAEIWAHCLNRDRVGVHDNFFELGGDSLLSIQIKGEAAERGLHFELHKLFEFPTIAELVEELDVEAGEAAGDPGPFGLLSDAERNALPQGIEDAYPPSDLQLGMLFHSNYAERAVEYHDVITYRLSIPFDGNAMEAAWADLVARHEILRTAFDLTHYERPLQLVQPQAQMPVHTRDLREHEDFEQALSDWMDQEIRTPFDYSKAPLFRVYLFRLTDATFQLALSFHHAILDGWSESTLLAELLNAYQTHREGGETDYEPPSVHYREFIALEQQTLHSEAAREYWRGAIDDDCEIALPKPLTRKPDDLPDSPQSHAMVDIPESLSDKLHQTAKQVGVPVKSVLLAAHMKALAVLTGVCDVVSGITCNGRPEKLGGERCLGLFLNTVPFRFKLPTGTWRELIEGIFRAETEMMTHRRFPLPAIMQMHGGERLYEASFNFTHFHAVTGIEGMSAEEAGETLLQRSGFTKASIPFLVNADVNPGSNLIRMQFAYDHQLVTPDRAQSWSELYGSVLQAMLDLNMRHESNAFLSEDDKVRLAKLNDMQREYPRGKALHVLFQETAANWREAPALVMEGASLSYERLNRAANQIAHHLIARGVGPDTPVGLCLAPSFRLFAAILGILKAGGAYLPLDPDYPDHRLTFMLEDANAPLIITEGHLAHRLEGIKVPSLQLPDDQLGPDGYPDTNPPNRTGSDNLAYINYTSGSTGKPKGVMVTHRNVTRLVFDTQYVSIKPGDGVAQVSNISFDALTFELWSALLHGGRLCLVERERFIEPESFAGAVASMGIRHMFITAALFSRFAAAKPDVFQGMGHVLAGGDRVPPEAARAVLKAGGPQSLQNGYGPTEATTFSLWYVIDQVTDDAQSIPIGKPIANSRAYILNPHLNPVPVGANGELFIAGDGLARGYLNRPMLTAERFVPEPYSGVEGARMYRSGDLVRLLADGEIDFVGRVDRQVKMRGFRIELGEIEFHLKQAESIDDAIVIVRQNADGDARLVAYLQGRTPIDALREALVNQLPGHMIPTDFVCLEQFPLTPNGKVDRDALPMPSQDETLDENYTAPGTPTEEAVIEVWCRLLERPRISVTANFFTLGGHSLLATRVISHLRERLDVELPIKAIYEHPVAVDLAQYIEIGLSLHEDASALDDEEFVEEGEI